MYFTKDELDLMIRSVEYYSNTLYDAFDEDSIEVKEIDELQNKLMHIYYSISVDDVPHLNT